MVFDIVSKFLLETMVAETLKAYLFLFCQILVGERLKAPVVE